MGRPAIARSIVTGVQTASASGPPQSLYRQSYTDGRYDRAMPYTVQEFQPTPNPNALKCVLDRPLPEPIRSFRSAAEAAGDPLGSALFAVPGVTAVLLSGGWLTVNKTK